MSIQLDPIQIPLNQDESVKDFLANCKKQKSVPVLESENVTSKQSLMLIPTVSQVFCYISRPIADIYAQKCSDDFPSPGGATPLHDVIWGYALYHRLQLGPSRARVDYVELRKSQMADAQHSAAARQHLTAQELQVFLDARYKNEFQRCFGCMDTSLFFQKAFSLALPITDISQLRKYLGEIELKENWVKDQFQFPLYASFCEDNWPTGEAIPHVSKAKIGGLKWCEVDDQKAKEILQLTKDQVQVQTFQELVQVNFNQIEAQEQKNKKYAEEAAKIFKQLEDEKNTEKQEPKNLQWLKKNCYKIEIEEVARRAFSLSLAEFVELQGCIDFVEGAKAILTPQMRDCCLKQEEIPIEEMPGWMLKVYALGLGNFFSEEEVAGIWDLKRRKKMAQIRPDCKWGSLAKMETQEKVQQSNVENPPKFYEVNVEPKQVQQVEQQFETPKKVNLEANPENKEESSQNADQQTGSKKEDEIPFVAVIQKSSQQQMEIQKTDNPPNNLGKVNLKLEIDYERDIEKFQKIVPKLSIEEAVAIKKHFQTLEQKLLPEKMVQILKGYEPQDGDKSRQAAWKTFEEQMELREFLGYLNKPEMRFILSQFDVQTPDVKNKKINLDQLEYTRFYQLLDRFNEQSKQSANYKRLSGKEYQQEPALKEEHTKELALKEQKNQVETKEEQNENSPNHLGSEQQDTIEGNKPKAELINQPICEIRKAEQNQIKQTEDQKQAKVEADPNKPISEFGKPELLQMLTDIKELSTIRRQMKLDFEEIALKGVSKEKVMKMDDKQLEELAQVCKTDFSKVSKAVKIVKSKVNLVKLCYLFEDMLEATAENKIDVAKYIKDMEPDFGSISQVSNPDLPQENPKPELNSQQNGQTLQQNPQVPDQQKAKNIPIKEIGKPELIQMFDDIKNLPTLKTQIKQDFDEIVEKKISKKKVMQMDDKQLEELAQVCKTDFGKVNITPIKLIKSKVWIVKLCYLFEDMLEVVREAGTKVPSQIEKMKPELPNDSDGATKQAEQNVIQNTSTNEQKPNKIEKNDEIPQSEKTIQKDSEKTRQKEQETETVKIPRKVSEENAKKYEKIVKDLNQSLKNCDVEKYAEVVELFKVLRKQLTMDLIQKIVEKQVVDVQNNMENTILRYDLEEDIQKELGLQDLSQQVGCFVSTDYVISAYILLELVEDKTSLLYKALAGQESETQKITVDQQADKLQKNVEIVENQETVDETHKDKEKKETNQQDVSKQGTEEKVEQIEKPFGFKQEDFVQMVKDLKEIPTFKKQIKSDFDEIIKLGKTKEEVLKMNDEELEELVQVCKTDFSQIDKEKAKIITSKVALVKLCYVYDDMLEAAALDGMNVPLFIKNLKGNKKPTPK